MAIDVLFIHPGDQKRIYQNLSKEFTAVATPVWTSLLANQARNKDYSAAIYDVNVQRWDKDTAKELALKYNPNLIVIGFSATPYRLSQGLLIDGTLFSKTLVDQTTPQWIGWFSSPLHSTACCGT